MNLTELTHAQGIHATTAYRCYREGKLPVPARKAWQADLVRDMIEVLTWFCAGLCGRRQARNRALKAAGCAQRGIGPQAQRWQECLTHPVGAEQVDGQGLLERGRIAQVIERLDTGIVDEDIERLDPPGSFLNLHCAGHVHTQRPDPLIRVSDRVTGSGIHPPRATP